MSTTEPTGRLERTSTGADLIVGRRIAAPIDEVWLDVTEPDRTARWFGRWRGEAAVGAQIEIQAGFEQGSPWMTARIEACVAPRWLAVTTSDEFGDWRLELRLTADGSSTLIDLVHHLDDVGDVGSVGPGWEYYLDMLVSSRTGAAAPEFDDYFPAMSEHYEAQAERLGLSAWAERPG